ncbi:MAG: RHS repeat-associated core domain-containing protein, partial [Eubacterium sp.]|nr:RHS repeat-associated core domain-containing protein [Eubacterium sp.]
MGNPLNYQGTDYTKATVDLKFEWDGRLLKSVTYPDNDDGNPAQRYEYSYNADGLRTQKDRYLWDKNVPGLRLYQTTEYVWDGNILKGYRLTYHSMNDNKPDETGSYIILPLYDENQEIMGIATKNYGEDITSNIPNGENVFYFEKDAQGNIVSMFNPLNNDYNVEYYYTGYGMTVLSIPKEEEKINRMPTGTFWEQLAKGLAEMGLAVLYSVYKELNPFMYRGYMYDGETGLYYNQSRYYSGEWGRFINADDPMYTDTGTGTPNANNMFAYCENDPVNNIDPTGLKPASRNYNIWVYYYQHKGKSKVKNPFGHLDISFGGQTYSYGDYSLGKKKANLFIANTTSYQNYINRYSTFKVQDKTKLMFTSSEYNRLKNYYNSLNKTWKYSSSNFKGN